MYTGNYTVFMQIHHSEKLACLAFQFKIISKHRPTSNFVLCLLFA